MNKELKVVLTAQDNASNVVKSFEQNLKSAGDTVSHVGQRLSVFNTALIDFSNRMLFVGGIVAGAFGVIGKGALDSAIKFEQYGIAFETMLGSAEKSKKLLEDIAVFATKTPFNLEDIVEGTKRLAAYGIEAEKLIPTMEMLGNITAGVGREKLPQLILAYGQVRAATKLTGAELRQFTEAGVPLLEALVNKANETGGAITQIGGLSKANSRKVNSLNAAIVDAEITLNFFKKTGKGTEKQIEALNNKIDRSKYALKEYGKDAEISYTRVKLSAEQMIDKISDGQVKFEDVHEALMAMTTEGGKFFNLMAKQSNTLGGTLANLSDAWQILSMAILGVSVTGEIAAGSLFDRLRGAAGQLLEFINANKQAIIDFFNGIGNAVLNAINSEPFQIFLNVLRQLGDWVIANGETILSWVRGFGVALLTLTVLGQIAALITFLLTPLGLIMVAIAALYVAWETNFYGMRDIMKIVGDYIIQAWDWIIMASQWAMERLTAFYMEHKEDFDAIWQAIVNLVKIVGYVIMSLWDYYGKNIIRIIESLWNIVSGLFRVAFALLTGIINAFVALVTGDWETLGTVLLTTAENLGKGLVSIFQGFLGVILNTFDMFFKGLAGWFGDMYEWVSDWAGKIRDKIGEAFDKDKKNSPSIMDRIKDTVYSVNHELGKLEAPQPLGHSPMFNQMQPVAPTTNKTININFGDLSVRNDNDIVAIANEVKRIINREDVLFSQGLY